MPYVPKVGKIPHPEIVSRFNRNSIDGISLKVTPIEIFSDEHPTNFVSRATGFFWENKADSYVITNWHVVAGRNNFTSEKLFGNNYYPTKVKIYVGGYVSDPNPPYHAFPTRRSPVEINLFNINGDPVWLQHPKFQDTRADIVAIPFPIGFLKSASNVNQFINEYNYNELFSYPGSDIFIVGYPFYNYTDTMIPIWKRGSIATEPWCPIDGKPMFLVDASTTHGMSGSPVFRRTFGPTNLLDGSLKLNSVVATEFVGVYSGRTISQEMVKCSLGIVWYDNIISEILEGGYSPKWDEVHNN